jgi:hypothetical protein
VSSVALVAAFSAFGAQAVPAGLTSSITAAALAKGAGATSALCLAKEVLRLMTWVKAKTAIAIGTGVLLAAGTTTVALKGISADDVISQLERQSGKRIAWDRQLALPATLDFEHMPLERTLDRLCVKTGAYWSLDYAIYSSDRALRQLLAALHEGTDLQTGGWTNLSSRPLQPNIFIERFDPHGRPSGVEQKTRIIRHQDTERSDPHGGPSGGAGGGRAGGGAQMAKNHPMSLVSMRVMLGPEASAQYS